MNDEDLQALSAYLDGVLPEPERRALEERLASSEALRRELEGLRAASRAVRDLPREPAPEGLIARVRARRERGERPRQDWVILPPALRPVAFALSCGIVALFIWNRVVYREPEETGPVHAVGIADVATRTQAPLSQYDVSGAVTQTPQAPLGDADRIAAGKAAADAAAARGGLSPNGHAPGAPIAGGAAPPEPASAIMTEQERSARNEELIAGLERQKKEMGIARVLTKREALLEQRGEELGGPPTEPASALRRSRPALLAERGWGSAVVPAPAPSGSTPASARPAPDAGLVFTEQQSLSAAWVLLGLPGRAPAADFSRGRVLLLKPSATKVLSAKAGPDAVTVVFRSLLPGETADPARDRVALIPQTPRAVIILDASR
ncbi:MAG: hypothetical protein KGM24_05375 [Elusimicrobia bacterium]|nr:hypothetical protein [Elusimicrobiota bacterium]